MRKADIPMGTKYGHLTVIGEGERAGVQRQRVMICQCDCGSAAKSIKLMHLKSGNTISCGCQQQSGSAATLTRHGKRLTGDRITKVYKTWQDMKSRCFNSNNCKYEYYGGRGITVCERWMAFENFYADMGDPPSPAHTIDRRENDGNYEPSNCRWATMDEQRCNRSDNVHITYGGRSQTVAQWAKELAIPHTTIRSRLKRGLAVELVFEKKDTQ
jgi:hypothetical protein